MTARTLRDLQAEVREVNTANGWHDDTRTRGEGLALLHSEVSEALEAYRDSGYEDLSAALCDVRWRDGQHPPDHLCKPEGVGSELADVLIRLLDTMDRHDESPTWLGLTVNEVAPFRVTAGEVFGDYLAALHKGIALEHWMKVARILRSAAQVASVDLEAETVRKLAYNRTRGHRHGGKRL